jgi:hypothetical protein
MLTMCAFESGAVRGVIARSKAAVISLTSFGGNRNLDQAQLDSFGAVRVGGIVVSMRP